MLVTINEQDPRPVYLQIANQVKEQIMRGDIKRGDELPSVRDLAESLGINMHTVRHAYSVLREQKIVVIRLGQQARVAGIRPTPPSREEVTRVIGERLRELVTEAYLMGLPAHEFRELVDEQIKKQGI
jgi:GntR family transcriptional regulator